MLNTRIVIDRLCSGNTVVLVDGNRKLCLSDGMYGRTLTYGLSLTIDDDYKNLAITSDLQVIQQHLEEELKDHHYTIFFEPKWIVLHGSSIQEFETQEEAISEISKIQTTSLDEIKLIKSESTNTWCY